nr:hypothetical protein CFP56_19305 [Quercus suber]POF19560.1 hypothetical protein CFP56_76639 [Quercus suber]
MSHDAKAQAAQSKDAAVKKLENDGVENPAGLSFIGFGALFLAAVPVTSFLTQRNGLLERAVNGVCHSVAWLGTAGATSTVAQTGKIAALSTLYITVTFALSGAASVGGQAASRKQGLNNKHPRANTANLRGLPLRLYSAHYNLMEMFPGFALTAALAQTIAPGDQGLINLLGLHVLAKVFLYYPSYIFNVDATRSLAHLLATASVINVALKLAQKPLLGL